MVAPRANWKGFVKFGELAFPVALYTAASTSERIAFHTLDRATGNRVRREFIDSETEEAVAREDQVKGFEIEDGRYVVLEPEEITAAIPNSDKTLKIEAFIPCDEVDDVYFDKPYYLAPDKMGSDAFKLLREGMNKSKVAAIARTVLFRRLRTLLIRPHGKGLIASTLNYDYEVRSSEQAFDEMPDLKIEGEMLELAKHIINTKKGAFDPSEFDDRYEAAVAELVKAKIEGRTLPKKKAPPSSKQSDLLQALRESAGIAAPAKTKRTAAGPNAGKGRQSAKRTAAPKSRASAGPQQRRPLGFDGASEAKKLGIAVSTTQVRSNGAQLAEIAPMLNDGTIRVAIDSIYSLSKAKEAHERAATGHIRGKIVLTATQEEQS